MLTNILVIITVLAVIFSVLVMLQPNSFEVTRGTTIVAPPQAVFSHVNNLHNWASWSPWEKMDASAAKTFTGPEAGQEAAMTWNSRSSQVGEGTMTIVESLPNEKISMRLEFRRPFKATNRATFHFAPQSDSTVVTWSLSGERSFLFKAMGLFMNCDKMVGSEFEKGLADLKMLVEKGSSVAN